MKGLRKGIAFFVAGLLLIGAMAVPAFATDQDLVSGTLEAVTLPTGTVTEDFALPVSDGEVSFNWASSDESSILPVGEKAYVLPDLGEKTTTLTVTASKGTATASREIHVKVGTYTYTGKGFINENFDGEALNAEIWQRDAKQIADDADNFMGVAAEADADSEGYNSNNKVYKIKRNSASGSPSLIHMNIGTDVLPAGSRIIYETRVRAEVQPTNKTSGAGAMTDFWWYRDNGNTYGKYGGFATAYVGQNKITVKPSLDTDKRSETAALADKEWKSFTFDVKANDGIFDFYLDGEHLADDYKMRGNGAPLKRLMFGFNADKNGEVWMDDVKVYLYPKTASELLANASFGVADLGAVDQNLTLPAVSEGEITWVSDKPEILDNTGVVNQSAVTGESETVNLYAIVNNSGVKTLQKYAVTVIGNGGTGGDDNTDVSEALDGIELADMVTEDFALPVSDGEVSFSWASSDESSILPVGEKAYVLPDLGKKTTTLTVTASKGTATDSREIPVKVGTYTYTGKGFINENFDGEALNAEIWQRDAKQIADDENNFMGVAAEAEADSEGYDSNNKVYKIKRNSTSGSPSLIHMNIGADVLPAGSRIIYETRVRAEVQPTNKTSGAGAMTDFWWYRDNGNTYGKYGGFATAYVGQNKITVKPSLDTDKRSETAALADKEWKSFTFDVKANDGIFDFYLDGEHLADDYKMRANGAPLKRLMFGFNADKNGEVWIDDVKVYLYPKTASELLVNASFGVADLGAVDQNLTLPAVSEGEITWVSDKPEILDNTGVVDQSAVTGESETVNLYAIVDNSGVKTVQKYEVTVNKEVKIPSELDELDIDEIVGDQPADALVKGFTLPAQTAGGTQIAWTSSDTSVIEIVNGTQAVIKPGDALKNAAITAKITVNGQEVSRVFSLGVAAAGPMDGELDINEIVGQDISDIQADFTLPEETKSGYSVTWESSIPESLFVHGGKAYVIRKIEKTDVTLSALIVKDGVESKMDYKLTIGKAPEVTSFLVNENFENIEVGKLPENDAVRQWGKDASVSDDNPNIDIGVQQENDTNKVLNVHHIEADGNQVGMMHLSFNAPKRGTIAVEYRYKYVVTDGGVPAKNTNANVWVNQTTGHTVAPSGNFVRLPFNDRTVYAQLGGSVTERIDYTGGDWHTMKAWLDLDQGLVTAYVDDQLLCKDAPKYQGDGAMRLQIGFDSANRGRCQLDDIKIYIDPVSVVANYAKSIDLGDLSAVMKDLEIPDKTPLGDADIMWVSSNPEIISTTGKVNHPTDKDSASVTLWALVESDGNRSLRTFNAVVPRMKTDEESVSMDLADLNLATAGLLLADEVHLPTVGAQGSTITWSSSHPTIIANDGKVSRIPYDTEKITEVVLTATVSKGSVVSQPKTFTFRVPERNYVLDATVTGSSSQGNKRFEFIKDNDSETAWAPAVTDKEQSLTITLPKARMVNMIKVNGSCGSVSMSYQSEGNNTYQRLGSGMDVEFSPKLVKTVKFEFTGVEEISSIGIYYTLTDQEAVEKDIEALNLGDLSSVTSNLKIPTVGAVCGSKITAKSSDPRYLSDKGVVSRPSEGDVDVVLTLTFTLGNYSVSKDYTVHILKKSSGGGSGGGSGSGSSHAGGGSGVPNVAPPIPEQNNDGTTDAFPDVKDIAWAKAAINNFAAKGFINGNEAGNFEPDRMISREEFLKMVLNAFGLKTGGAACDFADVPEDSWYYGYVATAYQLGIVNGIGDGKFGSGQPILRCDMAVMIQKAAEAANLNRNAGVEKQFADEADIPAYAVESVKNLSGLGVINGFEDNTFRPADEASRAQAVVMLYNYLNRK